MVSVRPRKTVGQSGKTAHAHSDRKIEPLAVRRVDSIFVRVAGNLAQADFHYLTGRVAGRIFVGEYLDDLAVVGARKDVGNHVLIRTPAVSRNLKALFAASAGQLFSERVAVLACAAAHVPREDKTGVPLHANEAI